jgi:uncharacterized protein (TIGR00645 family)
VPFANPAHDSPQQLTYWREGTTLRALLEGRGRDRNRDAVDRENRRDSSSSRRVAERVVSIRLRMPRPPSPLDAKMLEKPLERLLFACRWLLAPLYLGLAIALIALGIKFFQEAFHVLGHIWTMKEADLILTVLALIDIVLVGSLIVMVMFSGYENFVSRIDADGAENALGWLGKLDAGTLKLKVAASIVAISSIHLLRIFMNTPQIENNKILWYVVLHLTFVASALLLGVLDRMSFAGHRDH